MGWVVFRWVGSHGLKPNLLSSTGHSTSPRPLSYLPGPSRTGVGLDPLEPSNPGPSKYSVPDRRDPALTGERVLGTRRLRLVVSFDPHPSNPTNGIRRRSIIREVEAADCYPRHLASTPDSQIWSGSTRPVWAQSHIY